LLDVEKVKSIVQEYYTRQLKFNIKNNITDAGSAYPILKAILIVQCYKLIQIIIIILTISYFFGILWHIITKDIIKWDVKEFYDVYHGYTTFYTFPDYELEIDTNGMEMDP
jgi:hypothetical protein